MADDDLYTNLITFSERHAQSCEGCTLSHTIFSSLVQPLAMLKVNFPDAYKSFISAMESKYD